MSEAPTNAPAILALVAAGKSPWEGWDLACQGVSAKGKAAAYARRRDQIQACRSAGLLDDDGLVTDAGTAVLRAPARREAFVG